MKPRILFEIRVLFPGALTDHPIRPGETVLAVEVDGSNLLDVKLVHFHATMVKVAGAYPNVLHFSVKSPAGVYWFEFNDQGECLVGLRSQVQGPAIPSMVGSHIAVALVWVKEGGGSIDDNVIVTAHSALSDCG